MRMINNVSVSMRSNKKHSLPPLCQAGILRRLDKKINSLIKMELRPCCSSSSCWVAEVSGATAIRWANQIEANKLQKIGKLILWLNSFFSLSGSKCIYSSLSGQWCNVRRHGAKLYRITMHHLSPRYIWYLPPCQESLCSDVTLSRTVPSSRLCSSYLSACLR